MSEHTTGRYTPAPARGDCPSDKLQFATRKQAKAFRRKPSGAALGVYRCPDCDWWHLGHMPQRVRKGAITKDAWIQTTQRRETR